MLNTECHSQTKGKLISDQLWAEFSIPGVNVLEEGGHTYTPAMPQIQTEIQDCSNVTPSLISPTDTFKNLFPAYLYFKTRHKSSENNHNKVNNSTDE